MWDSEAVEFVRHGRRAEIEEELVLDASIEVDLRYIQPVIGEGATEASSGETTVRALFPTRYEPTYSMRCRNAGRAISSCSGCRTVCYK